MKSPKNRGVSGAYLEKWARKGKISCLLEWSEQSLGKTARCVIHDHHFQKSEETLKGSLHGVESTLIEILEAASKSGMAIGYGDAKKRYKYGRPLIE
jgi:hypothetical protein